MGLALVTVKNMKEPLISRYTSNWPGPYTNTAELFYAGPKHQRQMIALADRQIQAQKAAAVEIAASNIEAAEVIACEISQQTDLLATTIVKMGSQLSSDIRWAVANLGDRICGSLDEIRWQLAQQGETLSRILTTLLNNRNNEAKQLVHQGRRHMDNGEYAEAEERFGLALKYDTTDYQVLLSLAFIEIHKNSAEAAFGYFRKSLTLPDSLDDEERARALWALARLHYTEYQYNKALEIAEQALALEKSPTGVSLFTVGVYAALAGNTDKCLNKIRSAIDAEATFFVKTAVDPDLENVRPRVLQLLSEIAARAYANTRKQINSLREAFEKSMKGSFVSSYRDLLEKARQYLEQAEAKLKSASYTDCLKLDYSAKALREAIAELARLEPIYEQQSRARETRQAIEGRHHSVLQTFGTMAKEEPVGKTGCLFTLMLYAIPGLCSYLSALMLPGHPVDLAVFLGVFVAPLVWPMFFLLFNPSGRAEMYPGLIVGLVVSSGIMHLTKVRAMLY